MSLSRLETVLDAGALSWPDGDISALRAPASTKGLPLERTSVEHGFKPEVTAWELRGISAVPRLTGHFAASYVAVPRSKAFAQALLSHAADLTGPGGLIVVDGQKTDGVDSLLRLCRKSFGDLEAQAKGHGKIFWFTVPAELPDWLRRAATETKGPNGFSTALSGFSPEAIDTGSALLAANLPRHIKGRVLDLGGGWGYLSSAIVAQPEVEQLDLVEAEYDALEAARRNLTDPRVNFLWEDATSASLKRDFYDLVVCNPPFHTSRKADPALGQAFLVAAARALRPSGCLALVANRHLPYEQTLRTLFGDITVVTEEQGYKVIHARKPMRRR